MRKLTSVIIYLIIGFSLVLLWGQTVKLNAQTTLRPEQVAIKVYELLPDFPLENQYINLETNNVDENNTLVNRLITYHQFVKRRPMIFRFDWRLTLADYLGVNETILAESYPGAKTLVINPLQGDKQAIGALNLRQRNQLIAALMSIYQPPTGDNLNPNDSEDSPNQSPKLPQPGDADLLKP
mgnify:CR=1 FL=1